MKRPILPAMLFIALCVNSPSGASEKNVSSNAGKFKDGWTGSKMDVDKEVDDGADDDKNNEAAEPGKFKKDPDDSYRDDSPSGDGWLKSRFGEDADNDVDTNTDKDGQDTPSR